MRMSDLSANFSSLANISSGVISTVLPLTAGISNLQFDNLGADETCSMIGPISIVATVYF